MLFLYLPTCSNLLLFNNAIDVHQNISSLKNSFILPVTLWVYGKKVSDNALVDSGATSTFLNQKVVRKNNLITKLLAIPYAVINVDSTSNKSGSIQESVREYLEIGSYKSTNQMLVTNLSDKDMIIGMPFLR
jgi:predicted aspartyl protease